MSSHRHKLILLPPNRVWRTYPGGKTLDELAREPNPADSHWAEDWIASSTPAVNPPEAAADQRFFEGSSDAARGMPGVSQVRVGHDPARRDFAALLSSDPEYFLGAAHVRKHGPQPHLLVKFLDSGTRLHFQVHPTREFARRVLGAPSGKTEAYHVLGVRDPRPGAACIYVGFQRPPTAARLREYILTQDIAAIEACFDPIPVRPGDTFLIPGGTPHALGAGIFMVEIQEPSDLVVRFEFERAGFVLPESARFMNRDIDFALSVFDLSPLPAEAIESHVRCRPKRLRELGPGSWQDELIGPDRTDCFRVVKTRLEAPYQRFETVCAIAIVTAGTLVAEAGGETHRLKTYDKVFLPAGLGPVTITPAGGPVELLECFPPSDDQSQHPSSSSFS